MIPETIVSRNIRKFTFASIILFAFSCLFSMTNHSISIYYQDSHSPIFWSCSIALDSEGKWYESDLHYCGYLVAIQMPLTNALHRKRGSLKCCNATDFLCFFPYMSLTGEIDERLSFILRIVSKCYHAFS